MPLQINTTDMTGKLAYLGSRPPSGTTGRCLAGLPIVPGRRQLSHGYNRKEVTQAQTTLTHFFDQVMGADRLTLVGELGVTRIGGLERQSEVRYGRDSIYGSPYGTCRLQPGLCQWQYWLPRLLHQHLLGLPRSRRLGTTAT